LQGLLPAPVEKFAIEQFYQCGAVAALVMGPRARGIATPDSDIDLAFFVPYYQGPEAIDFIIEGYEVGLAWYDLDQFAAWCERPLLDFKELRLAGRLAFGKALRVDTGLPPAITRKCFNATLAPQSAHRLFKIIDRNTKKDFLDTLRNQEDALYALQGAAGALVTMALYMTPFRFQKPKWVVHDLAATGHHDLIGVLSASYGVNCDLGIDRATVIVGRLAEHLETGLKLLVRAGGTSSNERRAKIASHNFRGANGLLASEDALGAVHTASVCIRIIAAGLSYSTANSDIPPALEWRRLALRAAITSECLSEPYCRRLGEAIARAGHELLNNYKTALTGAGLVGR